MHRLFLASLILISLIAMPVTSQARPAARKASKPRIDRIDPPHWWAGMATDTLQLMVYGPGIGDAEMTLAGSHPGVEIAETVRLDSPDYLVAYLAVAQDAEPQTLALDFRNPGKKGASTRVDYQLRERHTTGASGFDTSDALYLIMPDRFAKGEAANRGHERDGLQYPAPDDADDPNARHGGNIAGMTEHLDYIDSLGVTAVWVNPVLENDMPGGSYHGYATTDYYAIDPRLGTNGEWKAFVDSCHKRGIKVVMDMIFNHCGSNHRWMANPPCRNWFNFPDSFVVTNHRLSTLYDPYASDFDRKRATDGWFVKEMPDLNQRNPHLKRYLIQNSIWWIEESGIDGIRMDTYPYADFNAMAEWCRDVEREYPDFNIVGECWYAHEAPEGFWQRGSRINRLGEPGLPTVMDFKLMTIARDAFTKETGPWTANGLNEIYNHLGFDFLLTDPKRILTFLDNHDTDRFLLEMPDDLAQWKQAQTFLLTSRGIPQIYYGTELLMHGSKEGSDGFIRLNVPEAEFTREGRSDLQNEAYDFLSSLLNWRKAHRDFFRTASLKHFAPVGTVYAYSLTSDAAPGRLFVILNGSDKEAEPDTSAWSEALKGHTRFTDVLTGETVDIVPGMTLAPRASLILR